MAENSRAHIVRLARRLRWTVWVVIVAAAALYLAARVGLSWGNFHVLTSGADGRALTLSRDLSAALTIAALWQLTRMLALVEQGERFSPPVTRSFRWFAMLLLAAATVTVVAPPVAVLLAPIPASHRIELPLNFRDIWTMVITGVLFLVAQLLDEAQRIESDLSEIV